MGPDFLGSDPISANYPLDDIEQVLKPHCTSVSLSVKWGDFKSTDFIELFGGLNELIYVRYLCNVI